MEHGNFIVLGKITGAYGIRGWLRILAYADDPQVWSQCPTWFLSPPDECLGAAEIQKNWQEYKVIKSKQNGNSLTALLDGTHNREAAESLKGMLIGLPRHLMPKLGSDEFYWADLIGSCVTNLTGYPLGKVAGLLETGANDVMEVTDQDGVTRLIPFIGNVIKSVGSEAKSIVVDWDPDW